MTDDDAPPMRRRIMELVQEYPGLHLREVARQLDTSVALVEYHAAALVDDGEVELVQDKRHHRLFPPDHGLPRRAVIALRDPKTLQVVLHLLAQPATHAELVHRTGLGKSTLSFHLRRMEDAELVVNQERTYHLVDPDRVRELIADNRPTPNLLRRFSDLWDDLYGG